MKTTLSSRPLLFLLVALLCMLSMLAQAQVREPPAMAARLSVATLERAFWDCDALATQVVLPPSLGADCATLADELKRRRFGGDFERMLAWWREHKPLEHAARADGPLCDGRCFDNAYQPAAASLPADEALPWESEPLDPLQAP